MEESKKDELACIYSAAILADDDIPITAEKLNTLINAAGISVESIWPTLFARALQGMNIRELISNVGATAGAAPTGGASTAAAGAEVKEEEKAEKKAEVEESDDDDDDDMGFGLFDD